MSILVWLKEKLGLEVWNYTCKRKHQWKSINSPRGTYNYGESGQTRCPVCRTPLVKGECISGILKGLKSRHINFYKNIN